MSYCKEKDLRQFILPPDTSGVTQKHDQLNDRLHKRYEEAKTNKSLMEVMVGWKRNW